jgi:hypothetical protein
MRGNKMVFAALTVIALSTVGSPSEALAQDGESDSPFGIGFQSSWPSYGVSGLYDMSERITLQAIVGALGTVTNFGGRALYRFQLEDKYDLYGFGAAGALRYSVAGFSENAIGFGGGGGVELDWRRIFTPEDDSFPPLFSTIDIGFMANTFETYGNYSALSMGGSIHYRF